MYCRMGMMIDNWRAGGSIVLVCLLCYGNAFEGGFHYDDFHSLVDNPGVRTLENTALFFADPGLFSGDPDKSMYRPLLLITYALNYAAGEYGVWGYHLVNLGLHVICSGLVWVLALRLLGRRRESFFCGLLFAVHPLATEPVNYISSRSESLAACFYLATFLFYLKEEEKGAYRYLSIAAYGLGLMTKSVVFTAPVLLWLYDCWVRGRSRKWWIYAPYAVVGAGYLLLIRWNGFLTGSLAAPVRDWGTQLWTQAKVPAYYLKLLFVPSGLNVEHQFFESVSPGEGVVLGGLALAGTLIWLAWSGGRRGVLGFSMAWCGVVLLPSMVMPLNMLVNERRLYLAVAGFAWIFGYLIRRVRSPAVYILLPLLGVLTIQRNPAWRNELTLWQDAAAKGPRMYRVQTNLGKALQLSGDDGGALQAYQRAIALDSRHGEAYNNMATIYHERAKLEGDGAVREQLLEAAVAWYLRALERYPGNAEFYQNLGDAYTLKGELDRAADMYERALEIRPENGGIWSNYGQTLYLAKNFMEAEKAFLKAVDLLPTRSEPYNNLGNIYSRRKELGRAVEMYQKAIEREPEELTQVLVNLGDTYREMGGFGDAREVFEGILERGPELADVYYRLGRVEREAGRTKAALEAFRRAAELDPGHAKVRVQWGEVLAENGDWGQAARLFQAAVEIDSTYSRAWYGLGVNLEKSGDREGAQQAYRRFLEVWEHSDGRSRQVAARLRQLLDQQEGE